MEMYSNSFTSTTVGGKTTRHIKTNSGVKQGCPLSSLLFNLTLDELTEKLKSLGIGIKINDQLVSVMAFTDELVLITEHSSHMTLAIKKCQKFLNLKGLSINVGKCGSLQVLPVKVKKAMKVVTYIYRWWEKSQFSPWILNSFRNIWVCLSDMIEKCPFYENKGILNQNDCGRVI